MYDNLKNIAPAIYIYIYKEYIAPAQGLSFFYSTSKQNKSKLSESKPPPNHLVKYQF